MRKRTLCEFFLRISSVSVPFQFSRSFIIHEPSGFLGTCAAVRGNENFFHLMNEVILIGKCEDGMNERCVKYSRILKAVAGFMGL